MKTDIGECVGTNARKKSEEFRRTGAWLNRAVFFRHDYRLPENGLETFQVVFQRCGIANRKENWVSFEILIANLIANRLRRPVKISLNRNAWKKNRYKVVGPQVIKIVYNLSEYGYIHLIKGFRTEEKAYLSRIWPTKALLEYFPERNKNVRYAPVELVELRGDNKQLLNYDDTAQTRRIRKILHKVMEVNQDAEIRFDDFSLSGTLVAIFKRKFTLYGRLHTRGLHQYQGLSGEERKEITIDGEPTVELDFRGLHPHLLYTRVGIQYDGDPYSVVDQCEIVRLFLKQILLTLINSIDEKTAVKAANYWLYKNYDYYLRLKRLGITCARPFIEKFIKTHEPISQFFCNGNENGLRIMNLDSKIALDVINHFVQQRIPILAIHDSFIVQKRYEAELYLTMKVAYRKHTGGFNIGIK
ncbi:MAG: hypothetical protein CVV48_01815 [Spirochaetae bacterium HGW-Spirochaetae-4]|nr:MAG: hypothetical protein CVV48_01815 [Spirochaetae bacterium HGW-Spirochaetae-4]